jgi:hypothetical protein
VVQVPVQQYPVVHVPGAEEQLVYELQVLVLHVPVHDGGVVHVLFA